MKGFYVTSRAWYADSINQEKDKIMIGNYSEEGGCSFEFSIEWEDFGDYKSPCINLYSDSFKAFSDFICIITYLSLNKSSLFSASALILRLLQLSTKYSFFNLLLDNIAYEYAPRATPISTPLFSFNLSINFINSILSLHII